MLAGIGFRMRASRGFESGQPRKNALFFTSSRRGGEEKLDVNVPAGYMPPPSESTRHNQQTSHEIVKFIILKWNLMVTLP